LKIGFIGNTNNYPFMLARAFKQHGADVLFFVNSASQLHRPEYYYPDVTLPYAEWMNDMSSMCIRDYVMPNRNTRRVIRALQSCDWVVLNGLGLSLGERINRPSLALLTGQDLSQYCDKRYPKVIAQQDKSIIGRITSPLVRMCYSRFIDLQRKGVKKSELVSYFPPGIDEKGDSILQELSVGASKRISLIMIDAEINKYSAPPRNDVPKLLYAARVSWTRNSEWVSGYNSNKGTDIFLRAVKRYYQKYKDKMNVCLVKKGRDVNQTLSLIRQLGIEDKISWLDEMTQLELIEEMKRSDIVADQFGTSMPGMVTYMAMSIGRPVVANTRMEFFKNLFPERIPICHAESEEEISDVIHDLVIDTKRRTELGSMARDYIEKYLSTSKRAQELLAMMVKV
jgi:glycosyltransferase involved in cell wall biosynthesis